MIVSMPRKLGGNRVCGRVLCHAFSAGIECRHCRALPTLFVSRGGHSDYVFRGKMVLF